LSLDQIRKPVMLEKIFKALALQMRNVKCEERESPGIRGKWLWLRPSTIVKIRKWFKFVG
jgi:hypothetical protein